MNKKISFIVLTTFILSSILLIALFSCILTKTVAQDTSFAQEDSIAYSLNIEKEDFATFTQLLKSDNPLTWTFNGSSTTANGGHYGNHYRNYVEIIEGRMRAEYSRKNDKFINIAVGGYTVNDFSYYEPNGAGSFNPDIAYINIGKNDSNWFLSTDGSFHHSGIMTHQISKLNPNLLYFKKKVEQFIDDARSSGALVILGVPNSMKMNYGQVEQRIFYEEYFAPAIREIADEKQVLLVDYLTHFVDNRMYADNFWFTDDGIHSNQLGYLELARVFFNDLGMYNSESIFSTLTFSELQNKPYAPYYTPLELDSNIEFAPEFDDKEPLFQTIINKNISSSIDYTQQALAAANEINSYGAGTLVTRFRTTSTAGSKRMFAMSADDEADSSVMLSAAYQSNFHCVSNNSLWSVKNIEVNDGAWHTAVVVSALSGTQIYIDGLLQYSNGNNLFGNDTPYTRVVIGGSTIDDPNHFIGDISYVQMYKGELSAAQAIEISSENLPSAGETELMEEFGYAGFSTQNLSALLKTQPVVFMGGAATMGSMKESVAERSFAQHLFKNSSKTNYQLLIGNTLELIDLSSRVEEQSVVFYMPEVIEQDGELTEVIVDTYIDNIISILDVLAKEKGCYVALISPYPVLNDSDINTAVAEYVEELNDLVEERGLVSLDIYNYIDQICKLNPNVSRNWTEENGLPNYIGHLEIAKRIAVFCGWGASSVVSAPNHTLQYTNPSHNSGVEHDNISAIVQETQDSKATRLIDVSAMLESYPDANFEFFIEMEDISSRVYPTDNIIKQKHPLKGSYTFVALAKMGEKTITFNPVVYTIIELDEAEVLPPQTNEGEENERKLQGWHIALIVVGGVAILCVIAVFVFESQIKEFIKKIKGKKNRAKEKKQLAKPQTENNEEQEAEQENVSQDIKKSNEQETDIPKKKNDETNNEIN